MFDDILSTLSFVDIFNICVFITFTFCYAYQLFYVLVVLTRKAPKQTAKKNHRYAVLIAARNENAVIGATLSTASACRITRKNLSTSS